MASLKGEIYDKYVFERVEDLLVIAENPRYNGYHWKSLSIKRK
jgi:hypothetical protein